MQPRRVESYLWQQAEKLPDKIAVYSGRQEVSYKELADRTLALAALLQDMGVQEGDFVGSLLPKGPELLMAFFAVASLGAVFFPIDPHQPRDVLHYVLSLTGPRVILGERAALNRARGVLSCRTLAVDSQGSIPGLEKYLSRSLMPMCADPFNVDDPVYINFTSGSTGLPKGAVTSHAQLFWNTNSALKTLHLGEDDIHLCMFPAFVHPHDIFCRSIFSGASLVLIDQIRPRSIAQAIVRHRVTAFMAVASIYETLVRLKEDYDFSSLCLAESGGMHVPAALMSAFKRKFGRQMTPVWGSTETAGIALAAPPELGAPLGSIGRPCAYYTVHIIDKDGQEAGPGEVGELVVQGPAVCKFYLENKEETRRYLRDGFFFTGDLAYKDDAGFFHFQGRRSGMMKVGGMRVYPVEIEEVLRAHPDVAEVAVVKENDQLHGEVPKAVVVLKNGGTLTKTALKKYCLSRLHSYKLPRIIEFVDALPKTPGGKVAFRVLEKPCDGKPSYGTP